MKRICISKHLYDKHQSEFYDVLLDWGTSNVWVLSSQWKKLTKVGRVFYG